MPTTHAKQQTAQLTVPDIQAAIDSAAPADVAMAGIALVMAHVQGHREAAQPAVETAHK